MIDQAHNETVKLIANWLNGASIALAIGGVVLPVLTYYTRRADAVWPDTIVLVVCAVLALSLHRLGQWVLGDLQSA